MNYYSPFYSTIVHLHFSGLFTPYLLRDVFRFATPCKSYFPRTIWYLTPGQSGTRPPRTATTECSCKLWPSPGIYAITSIPFVRRTLATFRWAELGFFGLTVYTLRQTPFRIGQPSRAGERTLSCVRGWWRPRMSWLMVDIWTRCCSSSGWVGNGGSKEWELSKNGLGSDERPVGWRWWYVVHVMEWKDEKERQLGAVDLIDRAEVKRLNSRRILERAGRKASYK